MSKLLSLLLIAFLIYWLVKHYGKSGERIQRPSSPGGVEDMVRCAQCGVHTPRSESIFSRGKFFCTDDHRRQHQQS